MSSPVTEHVGPSRLLASPAPLLGLGWNYREVQTLCPTRRLWSSWKDRFVGYTRSQRNIRMSMERLRLELIHSRCLTNECWTGELSSFDTWIIGDKVVRPPGDLMLGFSVCGQVGQWLKHRSGCKVLASLAQLSPCFRTQPAFDLQWFQVHLTSEPPPWP